MYFTRGYTFHTKKHGLRKSTANYGIHVPGEPDYYGLLQEIIEVTYPGIINMKCILFKCDWYDPTPGRGVRKNNTSGVVDVNANRSYNRFEPFILPSQAEQVCFISYPQIRQKRETWLSVIKVNPRGRIVGLDADVAMQQDIVEEIFTPIVSTEDVIHVDPTNTEEVEYIDDVSTEDPESDEFEEPNTDEGERSENSNVSENESENEFE